MTNKVIYQIALQQSAYDCNCNAEDFLSEQNIVTLSKPHPKARKFLPLPFECDLVSYGNNIVVQVSDRTRNAIKSGFRPAWVELTARDIEFVNVLAKCK